MRTIERNIVGGFIFSKDGKLLLGKSRKGGVYQGAWLVPGGGVEIEETLLDALQREIIEETGIDIRHDAQIRQVDGALSGQSAKILRNTGEKVMVQMQFFNFKVQLHKNAKDIRVRTDDDFTDARWFNTDELPKLHLSTPTATTLQKLECLPAHE